MKLKFLKKFNQKDLAIDAKTIQRDFDLLRKYLSDMFPTDASTSFAPFNRFLTEDLNDYIIANIKSDDNRPQNLYTEELLPFHTRDNLWLAKYIQESIKYINKIHQLIHEKNIPDNVNPLNQNKGAKSKQPKIKFTHILKFIENSSDFDTTRNLFEVDVIRAQIRYMMKAKQPNGLLMKSEYNPTYGLFMLKSVYEPATARTYRNCDKTFRQGVLYAAEQLGVNLHSAEIALEKHADLWRTETMTDAFYNQYRLVPTKKGTSEDAFNWYSINFECEKIKPIWLKRREYQYYLEHKEIIDELGTVTPAMKMSTEELNKIDEEIAIWRKHYRAYIHSKETNNVNDKNTQPTDLTF